jgi:hypothetical protein
MKTRWLDRSIARQGPYLALCLSEAEFRAATSHLKSPEAPRWISRGANAMMHTFEHLDGKTVCIVCIGDDRTGLSPVEVAGLLIHEAVHVWQRYCADIGERYPGDEQEAYGIQAIAQELLAEYARRL